MAFHNDLGKTGERLAAEFLEREGYEILAKNFTYRKAEIDILAMRSNILVAIEVKTRTRCYAGRPQDFVSNDKIRLMIMAVNEFVKQNSIDAEVRFDIIGVSKKGQGFNIEHLVDAFYHF